MEIITCCQVNYYPELQELVTMKQPNIVIDRERIVIQAEQELQKLISLYPRLVGIFESQELCEETRKCDLASAEFVCPRCNKKQIVDIPEGKNKVALDHGDHVVTLMIDKEGKVRRMQCVDSLCESVSKEVRKRTFKSFVETLRNEKKR